MILRIFFGSIFSLPEFNSCRTLLITWQNWQNGNRKTWKYLLWRAEQRCNFMYLTCHLHHLNCAFSCIYVTYSSKSNKELKSFWKYSYLKKWECVWMTHVKLFVLDLSMNTMEHGFNWCNSAKMKVYPPKKCYRIIFWLFIKYIISNSFDNTKAQTLIIFTTPLKWRKCKKKFKDLFHF